jgi:hypothetical protein
VPIQYYIEVNEGLIDKLYHQNNPHGYLIPVIKKHVFLATNRCFEKCPDIFAIKEEHLRPDKYLPNKCKACTRYK